MQLDDGLFWKGDELHELYSKPLQCGALWSRLHRLPGAFHFRTKVKSHSFFKSKVKVKNLCLKTNSLYLKRDFVFVFDERLLFVFVFDEGFCICTCI